MGASPTGTRFRTTSWTLVLRARVSCEDLEELLRRYWSPVYAFLRRSGWKQHEAEDLTQAFLADVVLKRDLIGRADPQRGRFRSFLLTALRRFAIDTRRRGSAGTDGRRTTFLPDDPDELRAAEPCESQDPAAAFDRHWAAAVFDVALRLTEQLCREDGMARHWRAFEARVRQPMLHGCEPVSIEALAGELDARDPQEIYDMVRTVKRKLRSSLAEAVAETVEDPSEVDQELGEVRRCLAL